MQLVVLIPAFLLFLYVIYKLVRDDYVFIRKNVSLEQMFDIAFISTAVGLVFSRLFYFLFHFHQGDNIFSLFFFANSGGFSFVGACFGTALALYLLGRYKKVPMERYFDFFTLAFVVALPVGFIASAFFATKTTLLFILGNALVYTIFAIFCLKYVYPKLSSRELKEGNVYVVFLVFFAIVLLLNEILLREDGNIVFLSVKSVVLGIFFLFSLVLFIRQGRDGFVNRKR